MGYFSIFISMKSPVNYTRYYFPNGLRWTLLILLLPLAIFLIFISWFIAAFFYIVIVTKEQKGYKATTRSRDYWVNYNEYTLYLRYDDNKQLPLFTMNEHEPFKIQVEKLSKNLGLNVENT